MVAGPNGSGKTTLIQTLRASPEVSLPALYINADDLGAQRGLDVRTAQKLAESNRRQALAHGHSFLYETVMSHPSKIAELQAAAAAGYAITVLFVATDNPEVNIERVALRVAAGGHHVPSDRIRARHQRSIVLAPSAIAFAAHAYVYDNTVWGTQAGQQLQATLMGTRLQSTSAQPANWVSELIERTNARAAELDALYRSAKDPMALAVPDLAAGTAEGVITVSGRYYALQLSQAADLLLVHDKALLSRPVVQGQGYRIEYADGVAKVTRRPAARLRTVHSTSK